MRRRVDPDDPNGLVLSPSHVEAKMLYSKISKQLKIDLEPHEQIHLLPQLLEDDKEEDPAAYLESLMEQFGDAETPCTTKVKQLGQFLARISLRGGYSVPLRVEVVKR